MNIFFLRVFCAAHGRPTVAGLETLGNEKRVAGSEAGVLWMYVGFESGTGSVACHSPADAYTRLCPRENSTSGGGKCATVMNVFADKRQCGRVSPTARLCICSEHQIYTELEVGLIMFSSL